MSQADKIGALTLWNNLHKKALEKANARIADLEFALAEAKDAVEYYKQKSKRISPDR